MVKDNKLSLIKPKNCFLKIFTNVLANQKTQHPGILIEDSVSKQSRSWLRFYQDPSYKAPVNLLWAYTFLHETYTAPPST